jgi:hypothetical protein
MIIADSTAWIDFWRRPSSEAAEILERLLRGRRVALVGIVLSELQRGLRSESERDRANGMLDGLPYIEMTRDLWERAGVIAQELDAQGLSIPITDVCVAAIAIEGNHEVFTRDKHFERVPGLRLYQPEGDSDA